MLTKDKLEAIHRVLPNLNHYQVLKLSPVASVDEIREAFHREALEFHPDQYFSSPDLALLDLSKQIYAKVVEAYRTLSNHSKRADYDKKMNTQGPKISEEDENAITSVQRKASGTISGAGVKFFKMAQTAVASRDYVSAKMNIQIALNADPNNPQYLQLNERIQSELKRVGAKKK